MKLIVIDQPEDDFVSQTIIYTNNCKYVQLATHENWWNDDEVALSCRIDSESIGLEIGEFKVDRSKKDKAKKELDAFCNGLAFTILNEYETNSSLNLTQSFQNFVKSKPWKEEYEGSEE